MTPGMRHGVMVDTAVDVVLVTLALAVLVAVVRLVKGPTLPDRVVALDLVASLSVAILAVAAMAFDEANLLQPALVVALVSFLGTVAFAQYLEKRASR
jgi:multicomponent Na+:H+ antiporter subunit F